jgi:hypothetical protein
MFISTGVTFFSNQSTLPNVYTTGLQLWWDAGIPASYPGSGTTITDLSGNGNNGTLRNNIVYTSSFGGGLYMASGEDEVDIVGNFLNSTKNWTICVFGDYAGNNFDRIWGGIMNGDSGDLGVGSDTSTQVKTIGSGGAQGFWNNVVSGSFTPNVNSMYSYQCDNRNNATGGPNLRSFWRNNISYPVVNATSTGQANQIEADEGFSWGGYDNPPGTNAVTGTSFVALVYNTNLVQAQIDQNYNAYKTRLGLP